jgi:hypothetical protein
MISSQSGTTICDTNRSYGDVTHTVVYLSFSRTVVRTEFLDTSINSCQTGQETKSVMTYGESLHRLEEGFRFNINFHTFQHQSKLNVLFVLSLDLVFFLIINFIKMKK